MASSSPSQRDKAGWRGKTARGETWTEFDSLPLGVKRLYWEAPYEYTALGAVEAFQAGQDMKSKVFRQLTAMCADVKRETLRLYGPTHPQAESGAW